jgi:hypothetical protein
MTKPSRRRTARTMLLVELSLSTIRTDFPDAVTEVCRIVGVRAEAEITGPVRTIERGCRQRAREDTGARRSATVSTNSP